MQVSDGGAALAVSSHDPINVSRETNGDVLVLFTVKVDKAPGERRGRRCAAMVRAAARARRSVLPANGKYVRYGMPLKCLAAKGADMTKVTAPFILETTGAGGLLAVRSAPRQRRGASPALRLRRLLVAALLLASAASAQQAGRSSRFPAAKFAARRLGRAGFPRDPLRRAAARRLALAPPQPVRAWQGVRDATHNGPACLQNSEGWNKANWLHASEDCLTLDVKTASLTGKRPVMVWIHGGSNRSGSSGGPANSDLTQQGVVAVGVQYRLGVLGFLSSPELSAEQGGSSGNYGLMDQIAALQWVHDNIAKFGGDPDNVTIYGESAGSQDVSLLLAAPGGARAVQKAIMESGTPGFGMPFAASRMPKSWAKTFAEKRRRRGRSRRVARSSPVALLTLQEKLHDPLAARRQLQLAAHDGRRQGPAARARPLIAANKPKPVIIGTNKVEFGPDAGDEPRSRTLAETGSAPTARRRCAAYRAEQVPDPRRAHLAMRIQSDAEFHCPADRLADLLASHGWPVWRYEFESAKTAASLATPTRSAGCSSAKPCPAAWRCRITGRRWR